MLHGCKKGKIMGSNVVDGLMEVLSDESLGLNKIILVDENGQNYRIDNLNVKEVLAHRENKLLFVNISKI
tara:strand:- start:1977 stop:2186 length:210 start_codon:yes stop_codon:yes gene_type:complete